MNTLNIKFLNILNDADAKTASVILNTEIQNHFIKSVNWHDQFPYCPDSEFIIARSVDSLYIKFKISEYNLRALYVNDQDPVWEDSCVEFFCKKPLSDTYMNFEFNCIGTCIATTRKGRDKNVVPFSENQMKQIDRFPLLYRQAFREKEGPGYWELTVRIPFELMEIDPTDLPEMLLGNFYKCADGTSTPHYVSWNPISTNIPDFHCPEFFGKLSFAK